MSLHLSVDLHLRLHHQAVAELTTEAGRLCTCWRVCERWDAFNIDKMTGAFVQLRTPLLITEEPQLLNKICVRNTSGLYRWATAQWLDSLPKSTANKIFINTTGYKNSERPVTTWWVSFTTDKTAAHKTQRQPTVSLDGKLQDWVEISRNLNVAFVH